MLIVPDTKYYNKDYEILNGILVTVKELDSQYEEYEFWQGKRDKRFQEVKKR